MYKRQHEAREHIISEANAEAAKITETANIESEALLSSANCTLETAKQEAHDIKAEAETEAENIIKTAQKDAATRIAEADAAVAERHEQLVALNSDLASRARMALEQTELYVNMLNLIADSQSVETLPADCDYDCENCDNKCDSYVPETSIHESLHEALHEAFNSDAKESESECTETECAELEPQKANSEYANLDNCTSDSTLNDDSVDEIQELSDGLCEESCSNPVSRSGADSEPDNTTASNNSDGIGAMDSTPRFSDDKMEYEPAFEPLTEANAENALPEANKAGNGVGALMRSIYSIEGRYAPDDSEEVLDVGEGTPLVRDDADDEQSSSIPFDSDLASILQDIL